MSARSARLAWAFVATLGVVALQDVGHELAQRPPAPVHLRRLAPVRLAQGRHDLVEAAACGTPSLASDSPGLRDSVRHGETGYLVPHGDVEVLATRMLELTDDPVLVARLGAGARAFAESLTWERTADETEAQLHAIIAGRA